MTLALHVDRLIDGTGAPPVADAVLVLEGGRVAAVYAGPPPEGALPPDAEHLRLPGCTALPGLVDAHVHLNLPGDGTALEEAAREGDGVLTATAALNAGARPARGHHHGARPRLRARAPCSTCAARSASGTARARASSPAGSRSP